jgi:uncharacterized protein (DUF4415 family)
VDAHEIQPEEYEELPELTDEMFMRGVAYRDEKRIAAISDRGQITLQLPLDVIERWKATGPGWQTRMVELLSKS